MHHDLFFEYYDNRVQISRKLFPWNFTRKRNHWCLRLIALYKILCKMRFSPAVNARKFVFRSGSRAIKWAPHVDHSSVENQRYHCSFMQTAHYSISEIIIADATDNDATGKNKISRYNRRQFMSTYLIYNCKWQSIESSRYLLNSPESRVNWKLCHKIM